MPLGRGVEPDHPLHKQIKESYKKPVQIIDEMIERLERFDGLPISIEELQLLKHLVKLNEEDLLDFYWQSSSAECPEDNYRV